MKVDFNNTPINFNAHPELKKLTQVIPNTKACKGLTELDRRCFQSYVYSLKFKSGITKEELNKILSLENSEFLNACYEFIISKLGLPESLRIPVNFQNLADEIQMAYYPGYEAISIIPDIMMYPKTRIFSLLRHEFQHYMQNLSVYRHEKIGEDAVEFYTNYVFNREKSVYENLMNKSEEEVIKLGFTKEFYEELMYLKDLRDNNTDGYNKYWDTMHETIKNNLTNVRNVVIKEMGVIKESTKAGKLAENFFEEFKQQCSGQNYYNDDGTINQQKYLSTLIEQEAAAAQQRWFCDFNNKCGFKEFKEEALDFIQQSE